MLAILYKKFMDRKLSTLMILQTYSLYCFVIIAATLGSRADEFITRRRSCRLSIRITTRGSQIDARYSPKKNPQSSACNNRAKSFKSARVDFSLLLLATQDQQLENVPATLN
jgi:hypothetical protein